MSQYGQEKDSAFVAAPPICVKHLM